MAHRLWSDCLLAGFALVACAGLSACNLEPRYRATAVTFDPGLLGRWEVEQKEGERADNSGPKEPAEIEFQARALKVEGGRIQPDKPAPEGSASNAYTVKVTDPEKQDQVYEFGAFLLAAGDQTLIGFQWTGGPSGAFQHPLHHVLRLKRTGDRLEVRGPKHDVVWMPAAQPLDPPPIPVGGQLPVPTAADLEARAKGGMFVAFDIDRMLEVYVAHAGDESFWSPDVGVAVRKGSSSPRGMLERTGAGDLAGAPLSGGMGGR